MTDYVTDKGRNAMVQSVYESNSRIGCVVTRNKNKNVIVFEVAGNKNDVTIIQYWLLLEDSYYEKAKTRREELSLLDNTVWGFTQTKTNHSNVVRIKLNRMPFIEFIVKLCDDNKVNCFYRSSKTNELRKVESVHVNDYKLLGMVEISVESVEIYYYDKSKTQLLCDKILNQ